MTQPNFVNFKPVGTSVAGTAAFSKFMRVLDMIASTPGENLTIHDLSQRLGYPRSTLYRITGALLAEGLIVEKGATNSFGPGPHLISLASYALETSDIRKIARDYLLELRDTTRETIHLAVLGDNGMIYIDKLDSPQAVRMNSRLGSRVTLYSSSVGKAYLSKLPEHERREIVSNLSFKRFTRMTITGASALLTELKSIAAQGFAEDCEENEGGIFCYGCAVLDKVERPIACVSVSIPLFRRSDKPETYTIPLMATCKAISKKASLLGFEF